MVKINFPIQGLDMSEYVLRKEVPRNCINEMEIESEEESEQKVIIWDKLSINRFCMIYSP